MCSSRLWGTAFAALESPLVSRRGSAKSALAQKTSRTALVRWELGSSREGVERARWDARSRESYPAGYTLVRVYPAG